MWLTPEILLATIAVGWVVGTAIGMIQTDIVESWLYRRRARKELEEIRRRYPDELPAITGRGVLPVETGIMPRPETEPAAREDDMSESDIHIPDEALEAARVAWLESASDYNRLDDSIRAACLAMLRAWPGMRDSQHVSFNGRVENAIILPLPAGDANA